MKKIIAIFLCISMGLTLLVGCGDNQKGSETSNEGSNPTENQEKVLIEGKASDSVTLDPFNATDIASWRVSRQIYDNLVGYETGTFAPTPSLAEKWSISDDNLVYTFTLRQGVKFHDGTDFNAEAVVFNFERWWDTNHEYHQGEFANFVSFFGGFKGDDACIIKDVKATGDYEVQVTLNSVYPAFLARLTDPSTAIISPDAIRKYGEEIGKNPVGTGPFVFESWIPNDNITLTKNENYWDGAPALDKVIFKVIPDSTARLIALQSGEIDIMDSLNTSDYNSVLNDSALQVIERPAINCGFYWFNTTKAPFDNVKVRQAISMAIDKEGIINSIYSGLAIPAKSVLSPSSWAYNDKMEDYKFDPTAAKQLLAEAGYPDGFDMVLTIRGESRAYFPQPQKLAEALQANLADIGIKATIESYEGSTMSSIVYSGDYSMAAWGTGGSDPDPALAIYHYFNKAAAVGERATNAARWINDEATELLTNAQSISNQDERAEMYREAQQIIHDEAVILPIVHVRAMLAAANYVTGYVGFTDYYESYSKVDIQK